MNSAYKSVCDFIREKLEKSTVASEIYSYGTVESCGDGIVHIKGLSESRYGELLELEGGAYAIALDLREDGVGAVLLDSSESVCAGAVVRGTDHVADVPVGEKLLGRVIDPVGRPLDGRELIPEKFRKTEASAPSIMDRSAVNTPLETGILAIDSMIPIGRGQRELIIGDRQTGKTSIALSAILNQTKGDVVCVYCAIGQKASDTAGLVHTLSEADALDNTVIVAAFSDDSAAMQYIAPYAACAVAEEFMYSGQDVLIVYDDLSKHAAAYRAMSLLLRRPSGREAYPGDIFYLHSRLLERAAKLSDSLGGASMTALPIVETLADDISAYIPTNVISITDGQIYLETDLFSAGVRPAVNVGLSVSRVGRSAQSDAMKKVSGSLRIDIAQYRDMAVFAQFGSDIDSATAQLLHHGERLTELLKQGVGERLSRADEVSLLLAASEKLFDGFAVSEISARRADFLSYIRAHAATAYMDIETEGKLSANDRELFISQMKDWLEDEKH